MKQSKAMLGISAMFLLFGISSVIRFSQMLFDSSENVKVPHVIGLIGGGFTCGVCTVGIIGGLLLRKKLLVDKTQNTKNDAGTA
jgi:hypothetical protein